MLLVCDPFLLAHSHEEVMRCRHLVEGYEKLYQELPGGMNERELSRELWEAQVGAILKNVSVNWAILSRLTIGTS